MPFRNWLLGRSVDREHRTLPGNACGQCPRPVECHPGKREGISIRISYDPVGQRPIVLQAQARLLAAAKKAATSGLTVQSSNRVAVHSGARWSGHPSRPLACRGTGRLGANPGQADLPLEVAIRAPDVRNQWLCGINVTAEHGWFASRRDGVMQLGKARDGNGPHEQFAAVCHSAERALAALDPIPAQFTRWQPDSCR